MKKILFLFGLAVVLIIVQYITYSTIAQNKLPKLAISNLIVNTNCAADTIIFSTEMALYTGGNNDIAPYKLNLLSADHFLELKKKVAPYTFIDEKTFNAYCENIAIKQQVNPKAMSAFKKSKSKLFINAVEEHNFYVNVNTNWSYKNQFYFKEDPYIWFLFDWVKI